MIRCDTHGDHFGAQTGYDGDITATHNAGVNFAFLDGHAKWVGGAPSSYYTYGWLAPKGYSL